MCIRDRLYHKPLYRLLVPQVKADIPSDLFNGVSRINDDGVIESIESDSEHIWGVQFHPELQAVEGDEAMKKLFGDCVKFIGFRKDIKNLYKGADLYVNSSQHEALSFLIIEAMAAGLPVIATDMGGNSDIVNDEAGCGMLVEYDNPDSMAVAMKCFLEDPAFAARCRENARRTIEDKFEIHKMARATYGVYEKALHD